MTLYDLASKLHGGFQHMLLVQAVTGLPRGGDGSHLSVFPSRLLKNFQVSFETVTAHTYVSTLVVVFVFAHVSAPAYRLASRM